MRDRVPDLMTWCGIERKNVIVDHRRRAIPPGGTHHVVEDAHLLPQRLHLLVRPAAPSYALYARETHTERLIGVGLLILSPHALSMPEWLTRSRGVTCCTKASSTDTQNPPQLFPQAVN
jgi:hypothetical protein